MARYVDGRTLTSPLYKINLVEIGLNLYYTDIIVYHGRRKLHSKFLAAQMSRLLQYDYSQPQQNDTHVMCSLQLVTSLAWRGEDMQVWLLYDPQIVADIFIWEGSVAVMVAFVNMGGRLDVVMPIELPLDVVVLGEVLEIVDDVVGAVLIEMTDGAHMFKIAETTLKASLVLSDEQDVLRHDLAELRKLEHRHIPRGESRELLVEVNRTTMMVRSLQTKSVPWHRHSKIDSVMHPCW